MRLGNPTAQQQVLSLGSAGEPTILRSLACTEIPRKYGGEHKEFSSESTSLRLLGRAVGWYHEGEPAGFIASIVGAILLLIVYRLTVGRRIT